MSQRRRKGNAVPVAHIHEYDVDDLESPDPPPPPRVSQSQNLTRDNRRRRNQDVDLPTSPQKKRKVASTSAEAPCDNSLNNIDDGEAGICDESGPKPWKRRHYATSDEPLRDFKQYVDEYMAELVRVDGRGDADVNACPTCPPDAQSLPRFRCAGCTGFSLYCARCTVRNHAKRPFCTVEEWDGECFVNAPLVSLGLRIQLGHPDGGTCPFATLVSKEFIVMDVGGIHRCAVYQCGCSGAMPLRQQLLRHRLFPASATAPRTACTFNLLEHFHHLTRHGKMTMYDFYNALEKMTDDIGVSGLKDRREVFTRCIREWRYLVLLKWGGRGNDAKRAPSDVRPGELAVRCPACPIPGENLPPDWQNAPEERKYLYFLIIALDACFHLKRRQVSSTEKDPRLIDGGAYMVCHGPFEKWIKEAGKQDETTSSCSGLSALEQANIRYSKGYAETGKGIGVCARHEFVQPNGVVPLQAGERYANMDYALGSLLRFHPPELKVVLSYDIACQFSKNLVERIKKLPPMLRFEVVALSMRFVIPKLHILGHQMSCQLLYNLAYLLGMARTDGESVERGWAHLGPLATSLRQMGPGSAADTLEDHLNYWNWLKLLALGVFLLRKLLEALKEEAIQRAHLEDFSRSQAGHVREWRAAVLRFEKDNKAPNPFELPKCTGGEQDVQQALAEEDAAAAASGAETAHPQSPAEFVVGLLEVEEKQRMLAKNVLGGAYSTPKAKTELFRQRAKLGREINRLDSARAVYMPPAAERLKSYQAQGANASVPIEERPLLPPSALPRVEQSSCIGGVAGMEARLRNAQCRSSLETVRTLLLAKSRELRFKNTNVRHQGASTRARALIDGYDEKIRAAAHKYNFARAALLALQDSASRPLQWRPIDLNRDLRSMEEPDPLARRARGAEDGEGPAATHPSQLQRLRDGTGKGRRTVSWIWYGTNTSDPDAQGAELYDGIRVEWCKAFARLRRWQEQILLVKEEMRRTRASLQHRANSWEARRLADARPGPVGEGARAYATRQWRIYEALNAHFAELWRQAPPTTQITVEDARRLEEDLDDDDDDDDPTQDGEGDEGDEGSEDDEA
ncbi:hypothetical protein HDZ31DRAFT_66538 [Schizophyllum fasciatum]